MSSASKSLGQFVADVLSVVGAATYVPAAVVVGGLGLAGLLASTDASTPIEAVAAAPSPTFAELALFVLVVALVAAILEPIQLKITRVFEGYWGQLGDSRVEARKRDRKCVSDRRNDLIADNTRLCRLAERVPATRWPLVSRHINKRRAETRRELRAVSAEFDKWPRAERVLPTRLGNTIRGFEDRASEALTESANAHMLPGSGEIQDLLPYAYFAIPPETRESHDRFRSQVQSLTTLVVVVPAVAVHVAAATLHLSWGWLWGLCVLGLGLVVAAAAHIGARDAGEGYGIMLLAIAQQYASGVFSVNSVAEEHAAELSA